MNRLASSVALEPFSVFFPFALSLLPTVFAFFPLLLELLEAERFFLLSILPFALLPSALAFVLFSLGASFSFFLSCCLEASLAFALAAFFSTGAAFFCFLSLLACSLPFSFCLPEGERFGRGFEEEEDEDELEACRRCFCGAAAFLRGAGALELPDREEAEELERARGFGLPRDPEALFRGSDLLLDLLEDAERDLDGRARGLDGPLDWDLRRGLEELDLRRERALRALRDLDRPRHALRAKGGAANCGWGGGRLLELLMTSSGHSWRAK